MPHLLFKYPLKLHSSQTVVGMAGKRREFKYPLKLHSSQTKLMFLFFALSFKYPLKLHSSQTIGGSLATYSRLSTL